ncbi:NEDD8-activating enzyme E1 regulatory subunit-like [Alosa alosa]|uniref:NEDD8-activating enzyme E1 regulatory subunit-like n=1 Tax=Alosa alosa TaxID=278164 RepID=UPI0020152C39|nr:NEDD8-activating enzyme E1 regulatory subunit-like [Alosa alosa]
MSPTHASVEGILTNEHGAPEDEENFEEAIKNVNTALNPTKITSAVEDLFNGEQCNNISAQTPPFWVVARAVREFVRNEGNGCLPVRGTIPDMIADSQKFINLQNVAARQCDRSLPLKPCRRAGAEE